MVEKKNKKTNNIKEVLKLERKLDILHWDNIIVINVERH